MSRGSPGFELRLPIHVLIESNCDQHNGDDGYFNEECGFHAEMIAEVRRLGNEKNYYL